MRIEDAVNGPFPLITEVDPADHPDATSVRVFPHPLRQLPPGHMAGQESLQAAVAGDRAWQYPRVLWTAAAVASATGGRVLTAAGAPPFTSVGIDSRRIRPGALFVPLQAARDGHEFVPAALGAGATGFLLDAGHRDRARLMAEAGGGVVIEVRDAAAALLDLGRAARNRLQGPVVGITGSVGKTSTKDLMAAALGAERRVTASERSFNNELGVPLTLVNAADDTEVAVIEMGARNIGHIALLSEVARPTIAVVTMVAAVHTELFGSIAAVARTKGELVEAIGAGGLAVLNADDPLVVAMAARTDADVLRYSATGAPADVVATDIRVAIDLRPSFVLASPWGEGPVTLGARGAHQVGNALAAATVALHQGVTWDGVTAALARAALSPWRMELVTTPSGAAVLNDSYNANPASMAAALRALAVLPARRRTAVVGTMAELGPSGPSEHRAISALADDLGIELIVVGTTDYGRPAVAGIEGALAALLPLDGDDAVLVKASRVVGLERLVSLLTAPEA
jgi:UDP-N-acetylmuramoyl-tripeptide--D-alanyl-D-alanine ligase